MSDLKVWSNGPASGKCDLCKSPVTRTVSDARVPRFGKWAWLCQSCAVEEEVSYGLGRGQLYAKEPGEARWVKVAG